MNSALIMRDKETDSYWSIMKGKATAGPLRGRALVKLAGAEKVRFRDWRRRYPNTRVLSVDGREDAPDPYERYWRDSAGFRGQSARDDRLKTKEPIFAFERGKEVFALAHARAEGGHVARGSGGVVFFFYRPPGAPLFASTDAFVSRTGFVKDRRGWVETETGAVFDPRQARFVGAEVERLSGLDTFWYTWSLEHPKTRVLP